MKAKTKTVINSLKSLMRWIEKIDAPKQDDEDQAVNTVIGCFYIPTDSPTTNIRAWLERAPRRKALKNASKCVNTKQGRRAIGELIALAISELEASCSFRPEVEVGPLQVAAKRGPKQLSQKHLSAMREGRKKQLAQQRDLTSRLLGNKSA